MPPTTTVQRSPSPITPSTKRVGQLDAAATKEATKEVGSADVATQARPDVITTGTGSQKDSAKVLGATASALDVYDHLPTPKSAREAFDTLPSSSSAGAGKVRRFADHNTLAWNMVLDLTRSAKHTQDFSFFTIEKDPYGYAFLGGALFNQMRGVQVTGMTDWSSNSRGRGFVSAGRGYDYMQELAAFGAKIGLFNTPMKRVQNLLKDGPSYGLIGCNHDKAMVIDKGTPDAQGETGGRNIAAPYHQDAQDNPKSWRDDTVHIKGDAATAGFATAIERELEGRACKLVKPDMINFKSRARELLMSYALMEEWVSRAPIDVAQKDLLRANEGARKDLAGKLIEAATARMTSMIATLPKDVQAKIPSSFSAGDRSTIEHLAEELVNDLELCGSRGAYDKHDGFVDGEIKVIDQTGAASAAPGQRYNEMAPALVHLFRGAQKEILIQNPYVVLTEHMIQALEDAAKRGVKITIVTNSPESTDSAITQGFFLNDWPALLARVPTAQIFVATGDRKFHAKCFQIDGEVSGDMSYNADLLSGLVNGEIGAITYSKALAEDLKARIAEDLKNAANDFREWTIKKDANGKAVLDGNGKPIVTHGPKDDVAKKLLRAYGPVQLMCKLISKTDAGAPLSHPPVDEVLKKRDW